MHPAAPTPIDQERQDRVKNGAWRARPWAGTVALIMSANPALRGDISGLRSILDNSATDVAAWDVAARPTTTTSSVRDG